MEIISTKSQYEEFYKCRFIYPNELQTATEIMQKERFSLLITGGAGSGKSTLLQLLVHGTPNKKHYRIIYGRNLRQNDFSSLDIDDEYLFLDGLDEAEHPNRVLSYIKEKGFRKIICTSRKLYSRDIFENIILLKGLTQNQISTLINMIGIEVDKQLLYSDILPRLNKNEFLSPRDVLRGIVSTLDNSETSKFLLECKNFIYQFDNKINFGAGEIDRSSLVIPQNKIITRVAFLEESLLQKAKNSPEIIYNFTPREFERFIYEFFCSQGMDVKLTKQTRDGGKDLIVVQKSILGEFSIYVECKKYDAQRPIGINLIRELYGTIMADSVTAGLLITTSYFTKDAHEYTKKIKNRMSLMDYSDLVKELNNLSI